jgi:hypothetical protein
MLRPSSTEWPIWHDDPWHNPQPRGGLVPRRHDIALARYLEKQRACRASTIHRFDLRATALGLRKLVARIGRDFFDACVPQVGEGHWSPRSLGGTIGSAQEHQVSVNIRSSTSGAKRIPPL